MSETAPPRSRGSAEDCRQFYLWHLGVPVAAAALVFALFEFTTLDRWINDWFYDPALRRFPLRDSWFLEVIGHHWAKYVLIVIGLSALTGFTLTFLIASLRSRRRAFLFVFLAMALGPALVGYLKDASNRHCPYDLAIYGGFAPHKGLLEAAEPGLQAGRCWPGGHASGGFGLFAFYFLWRRCRPTRARIALGVALGYGLLLGLGRMLQGAHFLSHNLWSAIVVWLVALLLYELLLRRLPASPT